MKLNLMISAVLLTLGMSCSGGGGSNNSNPAGGSSIEGLNLSGTWRFAGVECYDLNTQALTAYGSPSGGSSVSTEVISGNNLSSEDLGSGSCKVTMSRRIVANLQSGTATGGYGTGTFGATTAATSPGASCSLSVTFNMAQGNINPLTLNSTYTQGQNIPQQSFEFLINTSYLAITSLIQVVGRPADVCFLVYQKI